MLFIKKIDFFDEMTHIIPVKNYSFQARYPFGRSSKPALEL
jgi:hypothetical protein